MADLLDALGTFDGFRQRVAGRLVTDFANTGIDLVNAFRDEDAKLRPIDLEEDFFKTKAELAAQTIGALGFPQKGQAAKQWLLENTRAPESTAGKITEDMSVFIVGALGAQKALTGSLKAVRGVQTLGRGATWGSAAVAGGIADFTYTDPDDPVRLSNFIPEGYRGPIFDYLAADPSKDESRLEARLKNALEGVVVGSTLDAIVGIFKGARQSSFVRNAGDSTAQAVDHEAALGLPRAEIKARIEAGSFDETRLLESIDMSPAAIRSATELGEAPGRVSMSDVPNLGRTVGQTIDAALEEGADIQSAIDHAINTNRLNFSELAKKDLELALRTIDIVAENVSAVVDRKVTHWNQTISEATDKARKLDPTLQGMERRLDKLASKVAEVRPELLMYRAMLQDSTTELVEMAGKVARAKEPQMMDEFINRMSFHMVLQAGVERTASGAGKLLNSLKITPGKNTLPDNLSDVFGRPLGETEIAIWNAISEGDSEELRKLAQSVASADKNALSIKALMQSSKGAIRFMNFLKGIRIRNMLSGLPTHSIGLISNSLSSLVIQAIESPLAALRTADGVDRITMLGSWKGLQAAAMEPVNLAKRYHTFMREHTKDIKGIRAKTKAAFEAMSVDGTDRIRTELGNTDIRWNDNHALARLWNSWADVMDVTSLGAMRFVDEVAKNINFTAETTSIATSRGLARGLRGADLDRFIDAQVKQARAIAAGGVEAEAHLMSSLVQGGMSGKDAAKYVLKINDMVGQGQELAKRAGFMDEIHNEFIKNLENALNQQDSVAAAAVKTFVMPFFRTTVKILAFVGDRTPVLNRLSKRNKEILQGLHGPRAQQRLRAQTLTGSAMYAAAGMLALSGQLTGKHRDDERDALLAAGIPEYSIRIPHTDKWISYTRADPFAVFLGIVADIHTISQDQDDPDFAMAAATGTVTALTSNIFHKTFMKGLADILMAAEEPKQFLPYLLDSNIRTTIPTLAAFQSTFEKVWNANSEEYRKERPDPSFTELRGWVDMAFGNAGVGRTVDYRDALGNPVKRNPLLGEMLGFRVTETTDSPALREMARLKRFPGNRELSLAPGFKMTQEEFQAFKQIMGKDLKVTQRLDAIVQSDGYRRLNNAQRTKVLSKVIRDARDASKATQVRSDPELQTKLLDYNRERLRKSLEQTEQQTNAVTLADILSQRRQTFKREED